MKKYLICIFALLLSCQKGGFDNDRDQIKSYYGLSINADYQGFGVIGRVFDENDEAVAHARVYAHGSKQYTFTNELGGFFISDPEAIERIYVQTDFGKGLQYNVKESTEKLTLLGDLNLLDEIAISGNVRSGDAPVAAAKISAMGTPFDTESSPSGEFVLSIPPGDYEVFCDHLLYEAIEEKGLSLAGHHKLNFNLSPMEYPSGRAKLKDSEKVIRGNTIPIQLQASRSVRYFRIHYYSSNLKQEFTQWTTIRSEIEMEKVADGYNSLGFQFMDQFSRTTDIQFIDFITTSYDESYRFYLGQYKEPVRIQSGEKAVFFLSVVRFPAVTPFPVKIPLSSKEMGPDLDLVKTHRTVLMM